MGNERHAASTPGTGYRRGTPDLAVEIVSPHDRYAEVEENVATWLAHGTRLVIVVNPRCQSLAVPRSATDVRHLAADDTLDGGDVVPGWRVPVRDLFR